MERSGEPTPKKWDHLDDPPPSVEDIDVDRIVWDPAYRSVAIDVLARDKQG